MENEGMPDPAGSLPEPRRFGETKRRDAWWLAPLLTFIVLLSFVVYATWAALPARVAADWLREAMRLFENAQPPAGNEEAILHWNACARLINRIEESGASAEESEAAFRDDAPV
jgi:hypothetical protein